MGDPAIMSQNLIVLPVAAQALLAFVVLFVMARARARSQKERGQNLQDLALASNSDWNEAALKAANNYKNLFEIPVLFFAAAAFALITRTVDGWMIGLAWLFVASRVLHTIIHVTSNTVMLRGPVFMIGFVAVMAMWLLIVWRVVATGF
jgi:hypothetical protein